MTTPVVEQPSKRRGGSRSRFGCLVCRQRHLRCDETKPACKRCEAASWHCEYVDGKKDRRIKWKHFEKETPLPSKRERVYLPPDEHPDLTTTERKAIVYFAQEAAPEIFGYLTSDLWTRLVPQRCHMSKTVRNAVVALTFAQQDLITSPSSVFSREVEVTTRLRRLDQSYGEALVQLQDYIESEDAPSKLEVLLTCMALLCCMLIRRQPQEAILHLDHGLGIVRNWEQEIMERRSKCQDRLDDSDFEAVAHAFGAIDVYATAYDDSRLLSFTPRDRNRLSSLDHFESFKDAQSTFLLLLRGAFKDLVECTPYKFSAVAEVPQHLRSQRRINRMSFKKWLAAFKSLVMEYETTDSPNVVETKEFRGKIAVMRTQHLAMETLLNETLCEEGQACQFPFDTKAAELLHWAELAIPGCETNLTEKRPSACNPLRFSLDIGVTPQLLLLAVKTSRPDIRHQAISALQRIPRVEGWYDPLQTALSLSSLDTYHEKEQVKHALHALYVSGLSTTSTSLEWPVHQAIVDKFGDSAGIGRLQELGPS